MDAGTGAGELGPIYPDKQRTKLTIQTSPTMANGHDQSVLRSQDGKTIKDDKNHSTI